MSETTERKELGAYELSRRKADAKMDDAWKRLSEAVDAMRGTPGNKPTIRLHDAMREIEKARDELRQ